MVARRISLGVIVTQPVVIFEWSSSKLDEVKIIQNNKAFNKIDVNYDIVTSTKNSKIRTRSN